MIMVSGHHYVDEKGAALVSDSDQISLVDTAVYFASTKPMLSFLMGSVSYPPGPQYDIYQGTRLEKDIVVEGAISSEAPINQGRYGCTDCSRYIDVGTTKSFPKNSLFLRKVFSSSAQSFDFGDVYALHPEQESHQHMGRIQVKFDQEGQVNGWQEGTYTPSTLKRSILKARFNRWSDTVQVEAQLQDVDVNRSWLQKIFSF